MKKTKQKGFTLIELLIVVGIIGILAAAVFASLDPLKRLQDSRDARRWSDISEMLNAIKVNQYDNRGNRYLPAIDSLIKGRKYMIVSGNISSGCDAQNDNCVDKISSTDDCVDLSGLVSSGYLSSIPVSPNADGDWSSSITGYVLTASSSGAIIIDACESENAPNGITLSR
jgi:prepilin-type N-terminal cleavage/methylation domain-containing protein